LGSIEERAFRADEPNDLVERKPFPGSSELRMREQFQASAQAEQGLNLSDTLSAI
jgi:hypothetical protein